MLLLEELGTRRPRPLQYVAGHDNISMTDCCAYPHGEHRPYGWVLSAEVVKLADTPS
jgi:hypothetical protein